MDMILEHPVNIEPQGHEPGLSSSQLNAQTGPPLWDSLPPNLINILHMTQFKAQLKHYLLNT